MRNIYFFTAIVCTFILVSDAVVSWGRGFGTGAVWGVTWVFTGSALVYFTQLSVFFFFVFYF